MVAEPGTLERACTHTAKKEPSSLSRRSSLTFLSLSLSLSLCLSVSLSHPLSVSLSLIAVRWGVPARVS
jgi:hypothetical protein